MATDIINIQSLFPAIKNAYPVSVRNGVNTFSFIGIDFGTSTTVVSIARINNKGITTDPIWLNQKLDDGTIMRSEKIPTVIAWHNQQLLVGTGAAELKHHLKKDINVWYSFKMELGENLGAKYYNSELDRNSDFPILNPKDAAKVFFQYLKEQIDKYVKTNNLSPNIQYAVSIPASFEANQRKELIDALEQNGISINKQSLIDEPNAAFLSYIEISSTENNPLTIPDLYNPTILVFDFGAGTCDISILELGKDEKGIYSKNLSISKFEKLGGDDIDRLIAIEYLFPQLLKENGRTKEEFRTREKEKIINQLLKASEQLKVKICENIALQMNNRILPTTATNKDYVSVGYSIEVGSRKGRLSCTEPKLSYREFNEVMKVFLKSSALIPYKSKNVEDEFVTIFSPIETALKKASLSKTDIDYILLIGGSSKNPYVQAELKKYFEESDLLIPRDLQTHVSAGAAIHSLIYNGFGKNIIQPIISEPFLVITKDETPRVILKAGTQIPCDLTEIDDLITNQDGQKAIELPICVGNRNKLLFNIQIVSSHQQGFSRNTSVKLQVHITADKVLHVWASAGGQSVSFELIHPFANKELTIEQQVILKAERQANLEAEQNGGKPTEQGLKALSKAYEKGGKDLRAAETLEQLNELYPNVCNYNPIGLLYGSAGLKDKAFEFAEKAYLYNKNATTAFNYALGLKDKDRQKFKEILEESLRIDPDNPHSLCELGKQLKKENNPEGKKMMGKAFETWKRKWESNQMSENDYGWLSFVADELGMREFAQQVRNSKPQFNGKKLYNSENLTVSYRKEGLMKR